ncbi:MAG: HD domain-containing protein [Bacteroidales bacterium]|nr:MAG: HD domain-containing protein [Bacteroidales bacterium]
MVFSTSANRNGFVQQTNSSIIDYRLKQGTPFEITLSGAGSITWNNLLYSYKLTREHSNWSDWSTDSKFVFTDIEPGNHICIFKARDAFGPESAELKLSLTIIPNFFRTQFTLIALIILVLLVIYTISRWRTFYFALERFKLESIINRRTEELVKEKEKTDNLLARVLPRETAAELKETGKVNTQKFNMATVLFSDIQGFTKITDELNPENLIDQLDKFFLYFDSVVDKYRIEKIKTIGDAYMCAGGIPHKNRTNPVEVVLAALEMLSYMREINLEHNPGQDIWDLRIGIDTGPIIAGVVGRNKLSYDIWGTTVNTASRMESSGEVGRINISGNTHIFVQDYFLCTYRGKMPIKNKGDIEMYFVDGIKPVLSNNLDLYRPNIEFQTQLQFLRFGDLEEFILEKLEKGLPKNLYYHNLKHTVDVYTQVELIGRSEDVNLEEQLMLQTAALFHDAGHLIDYDTHEEMGVKLAREILPGYQYSERQIEIISDLIMVTKLPPKPKNLLEAIMCDADLDYLGRTDFIPVSNMLYKELHEHGRIGTIQEWNELQIKFIEKHQYFTNTARKLRNVNKNSQLENIKEWIEKNKL